MLQNSACLFQKVGNERIVSHVCQVLQCVGYVVCLVAKEVQPYGAVKCHIEWQNKWLKKGCVEARRGEAEFRSRNHDGCPPTSLRGRRPYIQCDTPIWKSRNLLLSHT